jgi:hypothetical protein
VKKLGVVDHIFYDGLRKARAVAHKEVRAGGSCVCSVSWMGSSRGGGPQAIWSVLGPTPQKGIEWYFGPYLAQVLNFCNMSKKKDMGFAERGGGVGVRATGGSSTFFPTSSMRPI